MIEEDPSSRPSPRPKVLVVDAKESLVVSVRAAAARFGGDAIGVTLADAANAATAHSPCALVVTEDVYANERSGLDRLALETGALLVVSSEAFEGRQLEGLLEDAIKRWRRSSYEKGAVLEGRYELLRDVGGRVAGSRWEVRHLRTARRSLLKVGVRVEGDESDSESVRREQLALASFNHPGSVDLRDAGTTEQGDPVHRGGDARGPHARGARRGARRAPDRRGVLRHSSRIADVLAAAHDACIRHGEVRPENVLIVRDAWGVERAKLVNWEATNLADGAADVAINLAGIGACAFLALAGRMRNEGEDVRSIRSGTWAPQDLPPALASVIARTLGGAGANRFTSTKELIEALDAAAPPAPEHLHLLDAKPERRGTSIRPVPIGLGRPSRGGGGRSSGTQAAFGRHGAPPLPPRRVPHARSRGGAGDRRGRRAERGRLGARPLRRHSRKDRRRRAGHRALRPPHRRQGRLGERRRALEPSASLR